MGFKILIVSIFGAVLLTVYGQDFTTIVTENITLSVSDHEVNNNIELL